MPVGVAEVFAPNRPPPAFAIKTALPLLLRPSAFMQNARDLVAIPDYMKTLSRRLEAIAQPVVFIAGAQDKVLSTRRQAAAAANIMPNAALVILENLGHSPHWAAPDAVLDAIRRLYDTRGYDL